MQLTGIWVAKFEASGINNDGIVAGNASSTSTTPSSAEGAYVRILPSQISWRHITIGESQYQSTLMSNNTEKYGWTGVNSHLIKNSEWGAVAYLCYSNYGSIPKTNGAGSKANGIFYDIYTGAGAKAIDDEGRYENFTEEVYGYNTELGMLASTTGNIYGIYDMAGGANERVATYFDNGNDNLNQYGYSTSNSNVVYFENGKLKEEYSHLWEAYEVSAEEKNNAIVVEGEETTKTQEELWDWNNRTLAYNQARYRLTQTIFNLMAKHKGIGVNETATEFSYYAPYGTSSESRTWFKTVKDTTNATIGELAQTWNEDFMLIGHILPTFVSRGDFCGSNTNAGVLYNSNTYGSEHYNGAFRPALAF